MLPSLGHRPEIDGLRAIAALSVFLFHLNPSLFSGGFVGVDIFFVISGFLIGHQLIYLIERKVFSFKEFYFRRARRILPAYFATLALVAILGLTFSTPDHLMSVSHEILASSLYVSNFYYFFEFLDYFAETTERSALLHTWSLSIEEQIYILLPIALVLAAKIRSSFPRILIFAAAFVSLALCLLWTYKLPQLAFFMTPFRAWEFLIGTIGALTVYRYPIRGRFASSVAFLSTLGLVSLNFVYSQEITFPGFFALVPCLLSLCIIFSCSKETSYYLLDSSILRFFAKISYSLYLIHWPVIVFAKIVLLKAEFSLIEQTTLFFTIITAAYVSYRVIEKPAMSVSFSHRKKLAVASFGALAGFLVLSAATIFLSGFPHRFSGDAEKYIATELDHDRESVCYEKDPESDERCLVGKSNIEPSLLIFGDSMANRLIPAFDQEMSAREDAGVVVSVGGCPPLFYFPEETREKCLFWSDIVADWLTKSPNVKHVVLIARWPSYRDGPDQSTGDLWIPATRFSIVSWDQNALLFDSSLGRTLELFDRLDIEVTFIEMFPVFPKSVPEILLARTRGVSVDTMIDKSLVEQRNAPFRDTLKHMAQEHDFRLVSFTEAICNDECLLQDANGFPTYSDASHPSQYGMDMILDDGSVAALIDPLLENVENSTGLFIFPQN